VALFVFPFRNVRCHPVKLSFALLQLRITCNQSKPITIISSLLLLISMSFAGEPKHTVIADLFAENYYITKLLGYETLKLCYI